MQEDCKTEELPLSKEEVEKIINNQKEYFERQIPLAKLRMELAGYNARASEYELRRLEATTKIAYMQQQPKSEKPIKLDTNGNTEDRQKV
jgi:hypothetical protein